MSRTELGHKQIQGIDYAYTLQGWLKDINGYRSSGLDIYDSYDSYDIGNDGIIQTGNVNRLFAHDGYASSIQYYQGDYTPVSGNNYFNELSYGAIPLYNGNISALSESIYNLYDRGLLKLFRYDKLNRIKQMRTAAHQDNNSGWESASDNFATDYSYDWNGNLLFLQRKNQSGQVMHSIRYTYPNGNNRLGAITSTGIASSVYQYDALGNLVRDNAEGLTVGWNAMGKVDTIHRNGSLLSSFRYSPTGQRQVKTDSSGTTFYIHDATGNVMCVYKLQGDTLTATERYLYGNKRLGMLEQQVWMTANNAWLQDSNTIGVRVYEFTDHLGNVTYTAQDRKWLVLDSYGQLQFIPATVNYTDYYPFGYPMWERSYYNGGYRYFFNGQEADNEVFGDRALHAFEYRMHDTRLGRFWSVDPLAGKFPWNSVYAFVENRVVDGRELEGLEWDPNKPLTTSNEQIPIRVVSASDNTRVIPTVSPKKNLQFQKTKMVYTPDPGEIRPALPEYAKTWAESAGYFGAYTYLDPIVRATATGGFVVTTGLFGQYAASDVLPYAVRGTDVLRTTTLKYYNNMKAKTVLGFAVGTTSYKLDLSPDISWPDPTVNFSSQITQIGLKILDEYNFFDIFNKQHAIQNRKQDTMDIQEKPQ